MLDTAQHHFQLKDATLLRDTAYIDGKWVKATSSFKVTNPANGKLIGNVPNMGADDAEAAIQAAHLAFPAWAAKTGKERSIIMRKWFDLIIAHADDLLSLIHI